MYWWCRVARNVLHQTYPLEYQIFSSQPRQKSCWAITLVYVWPLRLLCWEERQQVVFIIIHQMRIVYRAENFNNIQIHTVYVIITTVGRQRSPFHVCSCSYSPQNRSFGISLWRRCLHFFLGSFTKTVSRYFPPLVSFIHQPHRGTLIHFLNYIRILVFSKFAEIF